MEKFHECTICFVEYSDISKPHILPCGHTLCSKCIVNMTKKQIITCPMCQKQFKSDLKSFPVNYAVFSSTISRAKNTGNTGNPSNEFLFENCVRLQKEIQALEKHEKNLEEIQEEVLIFNTKIYNDASVQANVVIDSINNAINQIKQKIDDCKRNNGTRIKKRRDEIVSSIEQRKKLMKVLLDAQQVNKTLDAGSMLELNTLRSIPSSELTLKKASFSNNFSDLSKQLTDSLSLSCTVRDENMSIKVENIELNRPQAKPEENKAVFGNRNPVVPPVQKNPQGNFFSPQQPKAQNPPLQGPTINYQYSDINQLIKTGQLNNNKPYPYIGSQDPNYVSDAARFEWNTEEFVFSPMPNPNSIYGNTNSINPFSNNPNSQFFKPQDERPPNIVPSNLYAEPTWEGQSNDDDYDFSSNLSSEDSKNSGQQGNLRNRGGRRHRRGGWDRGRDRGRFGGRGRRRSGPRGPREQNSSNASFDSHDQQPNPGGFDWNNVGQGPPQNNPVNVPVNSFNHENQEITRGQKPNNSENNSWFIQCGQELKPLPRWVVNQIERNMGKHPLIRIFDRNTLTNIADTNKMIYYQLDKDGNRIPGRETNLLHITN